MSKQAEDINDNSKADAENSDNNWLEDAKVFNLEELSLLGMISEYMKGTFDLEEVRNDPALPGLENIVKEMITDYRSRNDRNKDNENYIREALARSEPEESISEEIRKIKREIKNNNLNGIAADWVNEWHENRKGNACRETQAEEIRDFIISSLENEMGESEITINRDKRKGLNRTLWRYIPFSAAAIISLVVVVRTLLPVYNPEKLFNTYYEPMVAISPVIRNSNSDESDSYIVAIEKYNLGNYQGAAIGFSVAIVKDSSAIDPLFFMSITQLALGNYDQAINMLSDIISRSAEYRKEAEWYLGLAYLKTGEKEKAFTCFELLTQTPGFFSERAEEIIRHLK